MKIRTTWFDTRGYGDGGEIMKHDGLLSQQKENDTLFENYRAFNIQWMILWVIFIWQSVVI